MKRSGILLLLFIIYTFINAQEVTKESAQKAAWCWLENYDGYTISNSNILTDTDGNILGYEFDLKPSGYLVLSSNKNLPPVIAYSLKSSFLWSSISLNPLQDMLINDLIVRTKHLPIISSALQKKNNKYWNLLLDYGSYQRMFEQWPPEGSTSTGGWLETNWKQTHPYNKFCPMDNINGQRSVAGCPAVALAMIIHYQKNINETQFSDSDDYYHSYAGRQYWIDDDATGWVFPDFPVMNNYFDSIEMKFLADASLNEDEIATLVFGCGIAAQQVYTSQVSGTFGVGQAYDAYQRFGYNSANLIYDSDTSFYTKMKNNIINARPVHLAVLSSTGQGGHNVVADGYNTDEYFHLNFGWGGSYNGWYLLPEEIPYNLTIIEGAVVDIEDYFVSTEDAYEDHFSEIEVFPNPTTLAFSLQFSVFSPQSSVVRIYDMNGKRVIVEAIPAGCGSITIDISGLMNGIYFCEIFIGNSSITHKIIKY